ncbi:hypothetical protein [Ruminococcus sp. 5_1_39BFAA]|uniref:hypothetical protein n=1 Tax=Ruminococcus sp. 5_1_39BFAA TaxID=457412 RepID=UPI003561C365
MNVEKKISEEKIIGYDWQGGKLVVNPFEAESVKWIFQSVTDYTKQPPRNLVDAAIERHRISEKVELSYEEAISKVYYCEILDYVTAELKQKYKLFKQTSSDSDIEEWKRILALPLETVEQQLANISSDNEKSHEPIISRELFEAVQSMKSGHMTSEAQKELLKKRAAETGFIVDMKCL